ncbi:MAG: YecA family protein, partial [Gemmatimonadaceae bacterium]
MHVGRNDSCPCGSGKKFKKCCGGLQTPTLVSPHAAHIARAEAAKEADRELVDRLMRYAVKRFGKRCLDEAMADYIDDPGSLDEAEFQLAFPWALFDYQREADGLTIAEVMRDDRAARLSPELREVLDAELRTWLSVWDVREVEPGIGLALKDLLTGAERFAHEVSGSRSLTPGHVLMGRVVDCDGVAFLGGMHPQVLPPMAADVVVREMRRICRVRTRPVAPAKLRDVDNQLALLDLWRMALEEANRPQPAPILTNTDGDLLLQTADHFEFTPGNARMVSQLLNTFSGADEGTMEGMDTVFVVTRPGNARMKSWDNTLIGRIVVKETRLVVESNSTRRADELRARLEKHLRGLVKHRFREESTMEALLSQARESSARGTSEPLTMEPELQAIARQWKETHMLEVWVNEQIPALGGLTPRAAAASRTSRAALELLL